jgi:hypothetical protein
MFAKIINIKNFKLNEKFTDNEMITINNKSVIKRSFENNQNIDTSLAVTSLTKLTNNVVNDVVQNNSAIASSAVGALNSLWLSGVECETINLDGIKQSTEAENQSLMKITQSNVSKISTDISSSIDKNIQSTGGPVLNEYEAKSNDALNKFAAEIPNFDPAKAQSMVAADEMCPASLLGTSSTECNGKVNSSFKLDESVRNYLKLDQSFKIEDNDNIDNEINNKISQANVANCKSQASSKNEIILNDIQCDVASAAAKAKRAGKKTLNKDGSLTISNIEQNAVAKLYMTCIIDQKNSSDISTKILNKISKKYNQIYDAVAKKAQELGDPDYYEKATKLIDTMSSAGMEQIHAAAGTLPKKPIDTTKKPDAPAPESNVALPSALDIQASADRLARQEELARQARIAKAAAEAEEARLAKIAQEAEEARLAKEAQMARDLELAKEAQLAEAQKTKMMMMFCCCVTVIFIIMGIIIFMKMGKSKKNDNNE